MKSREGKYFPIRSPMKAGRRSATRFMKEVGVNRKKATKKKMIVKQQPFIIEARRFEPRFCH